MKKIVVIFAAVFILFYGTASAGPRYSGVTPLPGAWTTPAYDAANFTANASMTWTVESGDVSTYAYTVIGKTMILAFWLGTTKVAGTPDTTLKIAIPGGYTPAKTIVTPVYILDNAVRTTGVCNAIANAATLSITRVDNAAFTAAANNTSIRGEVTFEVN